MPLKLDDYKLSDWTDDTISPIYLGYVTIEGHWYIKRMDTAARTTRYAVGLIDYATNFANRAALDYYFLYEVF